MAQVCAENEELQDRWSRYQGQKMKGIIRGCSEMTSTRRCFLLTGGGRTGGVVRKVFSENSQNFNLNEIMFCKISIVSIAN